MDPLRPYSSLAKPSFPANDVSSRLKTELLSFELDLSTARTFNNLAQPFADLPISGNAFFVDQNSDVGNATIVFADQPLPGTVVPVFVQAGFIARVPFTRVMIANTAQAGKKLRFFYGVDIDFVPSINGTFSISGTVGVTPTLGANGATTDQGYIYGAAFSSTTALAAGTNEQIVAPGSNVNGVILWEAEIISAVGATTQLLTLLAKSSAPTAINDGDVMLQCPCPGSSLSADVQLTRPRRIAAGKGLYFRSLQLETFSLRKALYTIL